MASEARRRQVGKEARRSARRHAISLVVACATLLWALGAAADPGLAVAEFTGAKSETMRKEVIAAFKKAELPVLDVSDVPDEKADAAELKRFAKEHDVVAFVYGDTRLKGKWKLTIVVRNGGDGKEIGTAEFSGGWLPALKKSVAKELMEKLEPIFENAGAEEEEPAEEPVDDQIAEDEPQPDDEDDAAKKEEPKEEVDSGPRPSPFSAELGVRGMIRTLRYNQDVNGTLRKHDAGMPAVALSLAWYPLAHVKGGTPANFGLTGEFEQGFASESKLESGDDTNAYQNAFRAYAAGLRFRIPADALEVGLSGKYGVHSFHIRGDHDPDAVVASGWRVPRNYVPDMRYEYLRFGLDCSYDLGAVGLGGSFGYRHLLGMGDITSDPWFPRAVGAAFDVGVSATYDLTESVYLRGLVDYRRFAMDMRSTPKDLDGDVPGAPDAKDRDVAGGASDTYLTFGGALGFRLPGSD